MENSEKNTEPIFWDIIGGYILCYGISFFITLLLAVPLLSRTHFDIAMFWFFVIPAIASIIVFFSILIIANVIPYKESDSHAFASLVLLGVMFVTSTLLVMMFLANPQIKQEIHNREIQSQSYIDQGGQPSCKDMSSESIVELTPVDNGYEVFTKYDYSNELKKTVLDTALEKYPQSFKEYYKLEYSPQVTTNIITHQECKIEADNKTLVVYDLYVLKTNKK